MLLLENSLFKKEQDKTTKYFIDIEKTIELAIKVDKDGIYQHLSKPWLKQIQVQKQAYLTHEPPQMIAQQIRRMRQIISPKLYTYY